MVVDKRPGLLLQVCERVLENQLGGRHRHVREMCHARDTLVRAVGIIRVYGCHRDHHFSKEVGLRHLLQPGIGVVSFRAGRRAGELEFPIRRGSNSRVQRKQGVQEGTAGAKATDDDEGLRDRNVFDGRVFHKKVVNLANDDERISLIYVQEQFRRLVSELLGRVEDEQLRTAVPEAVFPLEIFQRDANSPRLQLLDGVAFNPVKGVTAESEKYKKQNEEKNILKIYFPLKKLFFPHFFIFSLGFI